MLQAMVFPPPPLVTNSSPFFRLPGGTLEAGSLGDVTILDLEAPFDVAAPFVSKASNSPFLGEKLRGRAVATVVGGHIRFDLRAPAVETQPRRATKKSKR